MKMYKMNRDLVTLKTHSTPLPLCEGNPLVTERFHAQRPGNVKLCVLLIYSLNKQFNKQLIITVTSNGRGGVSNHQPHNCLLNFLFRRRSKKTSKLRVTGLCVGYSPVTDEFPAQMASNAESVSIWWRHHGSDSLRHHDAHVTLL